MMQIKLDNRLEAVSHLILPNKPMADIGTDHAYLPVYMIINDLVPYAIATDRVRGPLASAKQLVELLSLDKQVSIRLGEGLKVLQPEEVDTIVISGMGGFTIKDILSSSPEILEHTQRLVLQPQSNVFLLRSYLMEMGWRIVAEDIAFESGFYYEIMAAEKGHMDLTDEEIEFGPFLLAQRHPLLIPFLQLKRADLAILIQDLSTREGQAVEKRLQELLFCAQRIDNLLENLNKEE